MNDDKIGQFELRNLILLNIPHGPLMMYSRICFSGYMYIIDRQHGTYVFLRMLAVQFSLQLNEVPCSKPITFLP